MVRPATLVEGESSRFMSQLLSMKLRRLQLVLESKSLRELLFVVWLRPLSPVSVLLVEVLEEHGGGVVVFGYGVLC